MSKSLLVIDTPEGCNKCLLHYDYLHCIVSENNRNELLKTKSIEEIREGYDYTIGHRPALCPLQPMPNELEPGISDEYVNYCQGFNDCINEILGEE